MISPDLEAAYRGTSYVVEMPGGTRLALKCGERSEDLDRLLEHYGATEWAFVTACNPRSTLLDEAANGVRMAKLDAVLRDRGLTGLAGSGQGESGDWPAEPSRLVLGISEADAVALARLFEQNAILAGGRGQAARLVWIAW